MDTTDRRTDDQIRQDLADVAAGSLPRFALADAVTESRATQLCRELGHKDHGRHCQEWISNGWTEHGCHCEGHTSRKA